MGNTKLNAEERKLTGRRVKTLRQAGVVPGNVYGSQIDSHSVQVAGAELGEAYESAGETGIIDLVIGRVSVPVLIHEIQTHPVTGETLHVDFRQVDLTRKIAAMVPIELVGESPAEKNGIGVMTQIMDEIEVEALPADFPDSIEVDVSTLEDVDGSVSVSELVYDKAKLKLLSDEEQVVARVAALRTEEEEAVEDESVEAETEAQDVEGNEMTEKVDESAEEKS